MDRKFQPYSAAELERIFRSNHTDRSIVADIISELNFRSSKQASLLKETIQQYLDNTQFKNNNQYRSEYTNNKSDPKKSHESKELDADLCKNLIIAKDRRISELEKRIKELESEWDIEYKRVGLHPKCPDFVLSAVQKAYRKALHPDAQKQEHKIEAENRFKKVEQTFDLIYKRINLSKNL